MLRRQFVSNSLAAVAASGIAGQLPAKTKGRDRRSMRWDLIVVGAGTAGLPAAIFASRRGARVLLLDSAAKIGGTLNLANGQVSAGGSRTQAVKGINDNPDMHYADVMQITRGLANKSVLRLTVDMAPKTINWLLDNGLTPLPEHPVTGESPGRPAYTTPRYIWGANEGRDILRVIEAQLEPELASGRVQIQLGTRVTQLITNRNGAVLGVRCSDMKGTQEFRGRHILLTTGGYAMNPVAFRKRSGYPGYAAGSYPSCLGDGLDLAESAGGSVRGHELHRAGLGSIMSAEQFPAKVYARFEMAPQLRLPWEIWVGSNGLRFVREDEPSTYNREQALLRLPDLRYAVVFNQTVLEQAPLAIPKWTRDKLLAHFNSHPMFHRADSLADLAQRARLDADNLAATVSAYSQAVVKQTDVLGRSHLPLTMNTGPYYAVIHLGHSATSATGIVVDEALRVVRQSDAQPIPNLYAAGEVLGSGVSLGNAFCPGMMLTPALAGGHWLGETLPLT